MRSTGSAGGLLLESEDPGRGLPAGCVEVLVQAGQRHRTVDPSTGHDGAHAPMADDQVLLDESLDRLAHRRAAHPEALGQPHLVVEPIAGAELTGLDRLTEELDDLEPERDRALPVQSPGVQGHSGSLSPLILTV
jgi:hypothetical protein